ncbi:MAG: hypothetical protein R2834_23040 [Rhodothermales bacterium]
MDQSKKKLPSPLRAWLAPLTRSELFSRSNRARRKEGDRYEAPAHRGLTISLCIFFSILLWFFSSLAETYSRTFVFDTQLENLPADEALSALPPATVRAEVQSEGMHLLRLFYHRPTIRLSAEASVIDLDEATRASLPEDIRLESTYPRYYPLEKEKRETRKIPIALDAAIDVPPTHALLEAPTISPDSVVVSGPESLIQTLQSWPTRHVAYPDLKDSLSVRVALEDSLVGIVELGIRSVALRARAAEFTEGTRVLDVMIGGVPSTAKSIQLDPPSVTVRFRVPLPQYDLAQKAPDFLAAVTYDDIRSDTTGYIIPRIELPQDIVLLDIEVAPSRVRYYDLLVDR